MEQQKLAGRIAVISGGLGDIGAAIAMELARRGADIAVGDLLPVGREAELQAAVEALGRRFVYRRADVANAGAVAEWLSSVEEALGLPDLIVPNAAVVTLKPITEITPAEWDRELQVNLSGAFYLAWHGARRLVQTGASGRIVFVGSWAAHAIHPSLAAYCVTKAGVRMLCQSLALELAPHGILVNEVAPGYVDAGLSARIFEQYPERRVRAAADVPNGALTTADEVAYQVAHLCDPANRQMVGATLLMDGGLSLITPAKSRDA